jgi:hypothetical protein
MNLMISTNKSNVFAGIFQIHVAVAKLRGLNKMRLDERWAVVATETSYLSA